MCLDFFMILPCLNGTLELPNDLFKGLPLYRVTIGISFCSLSCIAYHILHCMTTSFPSRIRKGLISTLSLYLFIVIIFDTSGVPLFTTFKVYTSGHLFCMATRTPSFDIIASRFAVPVSDSFYSYSNRLTCPCIVHDKDQGPLHVIGN